MRHRVIVCLLTLPACFGAWYAATLAAQSLRGPGGGSPEEGLVVEGGPIAEVEHNSRTSSYEHLFRLTNQSSVPVEIERVSTGCACSIAEAPTGAIPPGETRDLRVSMVAFPMDEAAARQDITITLGGGRGTLVLKLRVKLPLPEQALFRPAVINLLPSKGETQITRTVGIRVPKHCGTRITTDQVRKVDCSDLEVSLTESPQTDMFYEYQLTVVAKVTPGPHPAKASLHVSTGCNDIDIPVYYFMDP